MFDSFGSFDSFRHMSLKQLKDEATNLPAVEQRELIAFLISQKTVRDENFRQTLAQKIDDKDASHWVDIDDLRQRHAE